MKRYSIKMFLLVGLVLLSTSCKKEINDPRDLFRQTQKLQGEKLELPKYTLGLPLHLVYFRGYLLVVDRYNESWLNIIDPQTKSQVCQCIPIGKGPNEMIELFGLKINGKKTFQTYDMRLRRIYEYHLDSILKHKKAIPFKAYRPEFNHIYLQITPVGENYLASGMLPKGKYHLLDSAFAKINEISEYPEVKEHTDRNHLNMAFQGHILYQESLQKAVWCCSKYPMFEILTFEDQNLRIQKFYHELPSYKENYNKNGGFALLRNSNAKYGYPDLKTTDNFIYLLYSGRTMDEYPDSFNESEHVLVFDWEGNPVKHYQLDNPVVSFAVSNDDKTLYSLIREPYPEIYTYKLK